MRHMLAGMAAMALTAASHAEPGDPIAVRSWGGGVMSVETLWGFTVVLAPADARPLPDDLAGADLVLRLSPERAEAGGRALAAGLPENWTELVLDRRPDQWPAQCGPTGTPEPTANAVRLRLVARGSGAASVDADGLRILFLAGGPAALTPAVGRAVGPVDVLCARADGTDAIPILRQAAIDTGARYLVPLGVPDGSLDAGDSLEIRRAVGNTLAVAVERGATRAAPALVVLKNEPWEMPAELAGLFERKERASRAAEDVFRPLSAAQLNFRPSNGTHTARWNAEHMMGRELGFFSAIYSNVDPAIARINLNPAQMPADYKPAHPEWSGAEEARQIARVRAFTARFAYLLDGIPLDDRPRGAPWALRRLLLTMEQHYGEHSANTKMKFDLPEWPGRNERGR